MYFGRIVCRNVTKLTESGIQLGDYGSFKYIQDTDFKNANALKSFILHRTQQHSNCLVFYKHTRKNRFFEQERSLE